MHMEQAQCDQEIMNITIKHILTKQEQSLYIVTTMSIHMVNEYPDMQANKLSAKYHLHVQHSTVATTLKLLHQGYKIQQGHKSTKDKANII